MPILEVRRHSIRKPGAGSQLSQDGVDLARRVGAELGPFVCVVTSIVPRARETAIAMGFAVDHEVVTLATDPGLYEQASTVDWGRSAHPFADLARLLSDDGPYRLYAHAVAAVWRDLLTPLTDDEAVLVIGHSGEVEAGLIACFPHADHRSWGPFFGACEGARVTFSGEAPHFTAIDFQRLREIA